MTDPTTTNTTTTLPSPLSCAIGSVIAGAMAIGLYFLNSSIAHYFAGKPIQSHNITVINITVALRTLIVGISTLATGIFSIIAIGLLALAIQVSIQQLKNQPAPPKS